MTVVTPVLVCTAGEFLGQTYDISEGVDVGRSEDNTIVIRDDGVSRFHARVIYENGKLWLQDAGSRNGVFRNGRRVTGHQELKHGDIVGVALHTFQVRSRNPDGNLEPLEGETAATTEQPAEKPRRWFWPFG